MNEPGAAATRAMLKEIYQNFEAPEGNFLEQFQSTGFNARYFELYLFAYLSRTGFEIDRTRPNPDFVVSRGGIHAAVEATTTNPSQKGFMAKHGRVVESLSPGELEDYQRNELPIRFGSPLLSKFNKRYWELEHCRKIPFVLAIQAFHDKDALTFSTY